MRIALIALILLLPAAPSATPTMGVYFDTSATQPWAVPIAYEIFHGYVYGKSINCPLDAVEFALAVPEALAVLGYSVPQGSLTLGTLGQGLSITYWPPLDGTDPNYCLLLTMDLMLLEACWCPYFGPVTDVMLWVVPDYEVGKILGSCWPENVLFEFTGLYSVVCPSLLCMGTEETNWSAIKSLYR